MLILSNVAPLIGAFLGFIAGAFYIIKMLKTPFPNKWGPIIIGIWMYSMAVSMVMMHYKINYGYKMLLYGVIFFFTMYPMFMILTYKYQTEKVKIQWKQAGKRILFLFATWLFFVLIVVVLIKN